MAGSKNRKRQHVILFSWVCNSMRMLVHNSPGVVLGHTITHRHRPKSRQSSLCCNDWISFCDARTLIVVLFNRAWRAFVLKRPFFKRLFYEKEINTRMKHNAIGMQILCEPAGCWKTGFDCCFSPPVVRTHVYELFGQVIFRLKNMWFFLVFSKKNKCINIGLPLFY